MINLLDGSILVHNHTHTTEMVLLIIMTSGIEIAIKGTITTIKKILNELTILENKVATIIDGTCHRTDNRSLEVCCPCCSAIEGD